MAEPRPETLELKRADDGHELWAAVEAAQYARVVEHDTPRTDDEAARIRDLVDLFAECSEQWDEKSLSDQTLALQQLGIRLAALRALGLSVYWAVIEGKVDTQSGRPAVLPVAVLVVARGDLPSIALGASGALGGD